MCYSRRLRWDATSRRRTDEVWDLFDREPREEEQPTPVMDAEPAGEEPVRREAEREAEPVGR